MMKSSTAWVIAIVCVVVAIVSVLLVVDNPVGMVNAARPTMQIVSGTEYLPGDAGQIIVEARFQNGTSALAGTCLLSVWYPDKSIAFLMNGTTGPNGNQYGNFTVPNVTGVYEYQAVCPLSTFINGTVSKSFHVAAKNGVIARITL